MYIKIYFNAKPLYLCNDIDHVIEPMIHHDDAIFIDELNSHTVKSMIHEMENSKVHSGIFFHHDLEKLKKAFFKKFKLVMAAGGLVLNHENACLMMRRRSKWDLPKGKLDKGEKVSECAIREVKEETGITELELIQPLIISYHTYHEGSRFILKDTHWFLMKTTKTQMFIPQKEEDITEVIWVKKDNLNKYLNNSYPSIADVINAYLEK